MIFEYDERITSKGISIKTPRIPITLVGSAHSWSGKGLIDSGADVSSIPFELAKLIGVIVTEDKKETITGAGKISCVLGLISLKLGDEQEYHMIHLPINVLMTSKKLPVLLGRSVFFDEFKILFDQRLSKIEMIRNREN